MAALPPKPETASGARVWRVAALVRAFADTLEARFNPLTVTGEISGFSRAASGHCYFTLKDSEADAGVRCAMFRRAAGLLDFSPRDGDAVELRAKVAVYEPRGELQLVVEHMRRAGLGALWEQFERLKAQLAAEAWFEPARKRPLPAFVRSIAIVTSLQAAALRDVSAALARRAPHVRAVVFPCAVQGSAAPAEIVEALLKIEQTIAKNRRRVGDFSHQYGVDDAQDLGFDAILVVRGGGSMEDLWAFNAPEVVRAIGSASVPVISGIGHETDFTLADFVADLRAPTPTAAAELVSQPTEALADHLNGLQDRLIAAIRERLDQQGQRLDRLESSLLRPQSQLAQGRLRLERLQARLLHALRQNLTHRAQALDRLQWRLDQGRDGIVARRRLELAQWAARLEALDPQRVLERGYALVTDGKGHVVASAHGLQPGDRLGLRLHDGSAEVRTETVQLVQSS